ncbi:hypothetical protein Q9L58_009947 [Maublancomyces gigas]|uniref:Uncharacterized protein n=1 Tax=Discina gigas TaxID=1032678 RepID=A0ABR3G5Y5_9PEZI
MDSTLGRSSWHSSKVELGGKKTAYFYRDPMLCIRHLLGQPAYKYDVVYAQTVEQNDVRERNSRKMNTADWWWETQEILPEGATDLPIICASDGTHVTNYSRDKKAWPAYITIGNIKETICNKPSNGAILQLALLPMPPKLGRETVQCKSLRRESQCAFHQALQYILLSLLNPSDNGSMIDFSDGHQRLCFPILCAWIADQEMHSTLHNIQSQACPKSEVSRNGLGDLQEYP